MSFRGIFADTRPLQVPAYRRLWTANIATTTGSSTYVELTGLYGGSTADSFDKPKVLVATTLGMIATALAFWGSSLNMILLQFSAIVGPLIAGAVALRAWMVVPMLVLGGAADIFSAALLTATLQRAAAKQLGAKLLETSPSSWD